MILRTYADASRILATARNAADGKPLENNTRLFARGDDFSVRLHSTDIVTIHPDDSVTLNSGGWLTVTTKDRWKEYSPGRVYSDRGVFTLYFAGGEFPYADGITMHVDGTVTGAGAANSAGEVRKLRRAAGRYASRYVDALYAGSIGRPDGGDCMFCRMFDSGSDRPSADHILSHLEESYFVPSLVHNALRSGGSIAARESVRALQAGETSGWAGIVRDQITRAIRRYVLSAVLPGTVASRG